MRSIMSTTHDAEDKKRPSHRAVSDDDLCRAVTGGATTREVADEVEIGRSNVWRRLNRLVDEGRVDRQMIGNSILWSRPSDPAP